MDKTTKKIKFLQQQELNAVRMYKTLAEKSKDERLSSLYSTLAAEEGKHAAKCRKFTDLTLKPGALMAVGIAFVRPLGKQATMSVIARFERLGGNIYQKLAAALPEFSDSAADELRHSEMLLAMKAELKGKNQ